MRGNELLTAASFRYALQSIMEQVGGTTIINVVPIPAGDVATCARACVQADRHDLFANKRKLEDHFGFTMTGYSVLRGEDPAKLKTCAYILHMRPAPRDRGKIPAIVYYLVL